MTHWFSVGLYNGQFYPLTKSEHVDKLLSQQRIHDLIHLDDYATERKIMKTWFPDEQILAYTLLIPRQDRFGRNGVWNYTVLFTFTDFLQYLAQQPELIVPPPPLQDAPNMEVFA